MFPLQLSTRRQARGTLQGQIKSGQYTIVGTYSRNLRVEVDKIGFRGVIEAGLTLHTQDIVQLNFSMAVGSNAETVTVNADENNINTTDATVGTVIDRQFVENMPLNGRSFQSLILLSPGVVTATPQPNNAQGEFSVNGMRTDANNFMVDGVSANNSNGAIDGGAGTGRHDIQHDSSRHDPCDYFCRRSRGISYCDFHLFR